MYELVSDVPEAVELEEPVLLHAFTGFVDAGSAVSLAADHLMATCEPRLLARFDIDQMYDYRGRRPSITFIGNRWTDYQEPTLDLYTMRDSAGTPFLLLTGPEPDLRWEAFTRGVLALIRRFGVRLAVGLGAVPMSVPHTRPIGVSAHATRETLIADRPVWVGRLQLPGHVSALLELRLGEAGHDAAGFAVHTPHYLARTEYPDAAAVLLGEICTMTGLELPTSDLLDRGTQVRVAVQAQIAEQPEVQALVTSLEEQYDLFIGTDRPGADLIHIPSAEELGAELERFLVEEDERRRRD
jgi:proteasome assembly chaperone (PAC2) family protein